jgi:hypothetical protein
MQDLSAWADGIADGGAGDEVCLVSWAAVEDQQNSRKIAARIETSGFFWCGSQTAMALCKFPWIVTKSAKRRNKMA